MNKRIWMFPVLLLAACAAAKDVDQRLDADPDGDVTVFNMAGSVEIEGWSRNSVEVSGSIGDDVEELVFERDGDEVNIRVKVPKRSRGRKDLSADLTIKVPKNSSLEVATVSADIDITGVHGEQELQAVSGDIDTEAYAGDIEIESVSGDIDVNGDGSDMSAELVSVSGDISADSLTGTVEAETVSGDLAIVDGSFDRIEMETVNGDITLRAELRRGGRLSGETVNGDVDIDFKGDVSAKFDIETFNGKIDNCFGPKPQRTSRYAPGWELSFTEGNGNGRVSLATLNGRIRFCN